MLKNIETQTIEPEESKDTEIVPILTTDNETQTVEQEELKESQSSATVPLEELQAQLQQSIQKSQDSELAY